MAFCGGQVGQTVVESPVEEGAGPTTRRDPNPNFRAGFDEQVRKMRR